MDTLFSITIAYYDTGVKGIYYVSNNNYKYISIQKGNYNGYIYGKNPAYHRWNRFIWTRGYGQVSIN